MFRGLAWGTLLAACGASTSVPADGGGSGDAPITPATCSHAPLALAAATLAGCAVNGNADGSRDDARFDDPVNVALGPDGKAYVADFDNGRIRVVDDAGTTTTLVTRDNFHHPFGLVFAPDGTLFVETDDNDQGAHSLQTGTIWRVDTATGTATVVARDLGRPRGLAMLPDGRIAMADYQHHVISLLDPATGTVAPLAGMVDIPGDVDATGSDARFAQPYDIAVLQGGDLVVSDVDNHRLRRVTLAGVVTGFAGSGTRGTIDGPLAVATFDAPQGLALAADGTIYVSDIKSHFIRRIAAGHVSTVAGDGTAGFLDNDVPRFARFYGLEGLDADATRIVVADGNVGNGMAFHRIRRITVSALPAP
jgi:sugar lactone lactonase YvrE